MKYITDGENKLIDNEKSENVAVRTLYTMARRKQRRCYFSYSLIFLCVIFFLSLIAGCLLYIYFERADTEFIFDVSSLGSASVGTLKSILKNYFLSFLPFALLFVLGFTSLSSLISGLLCAGFGAFSGFYITNVLKSFPEGLLSASVPLGLYCIILLYFSAISVSFSHSMRPSRQFKGMLEEDLACYLRYLLTSASFVLAVCIIHHII